jgi:hypothetical protein
MSVIGDFQVNGLFPSVVGGTGTTVKYFPRVLGTAGPNGGQSVAPSTTSAAGQLAVPGNSSVNGQLFNVELAASFGNDSGDPSGTVELALYANTGTVSSPSYTKIATTGAATPAAQPLHAALRVSLIGDSKSGIVSGFQTGVKGDGTLVTLAALTAGLTGINFANGLPFGLVAGVVFGSSDASNTASLYQFQIIGA